MNETKIFTNSEFGVLEVVMIEGKEMFPATECAKKLGYTNPQRAIRDHCKGVNETVTPSAGGMQKTKYIPESDLLRLIVKSRLPEAERFERWVFEEVLPTIRKHGAYLTPEKIEEVLFNPDTIIQIATQLKQEREEKLRLLNENLELKPKADYLETILQNKGLVTITQIAKDYGMSGKRLNAILHDLKVQYKQSDQWLLYSKYQDKGYVHSKTIAIVRSDGSEAVKMNTKWTQEGRLFLYEKLKAIGLLPLIETTTLKVSSKT